MVERSTQKGAEENVGQSYKGFALPNNQILEFKTQIIQLKFKKDKPFSEILEQVRNFSFHCTVSTRFT